MPAKAPVCIVAATAKPHRPPDFDLQTPMFIHFRKFFYE